MDKYVQLEQKMYDIIKDQCNCYSKNTEKKT